MFDVIPLLTLDESAPLWTFTPIMPRRESVCVIMCFRGGAAVPREVFRGQRSVPAGAADGNPELLSAVGGSGVFTRIEEASLRCLVRALSPPDRSNEWQIHLKLKWVIFCSFRVWLVMWHAEGWKMMVWDTTLIYQTSGGLNYLYSRAQKYEQYVIIPFYILHRENDWFLSPVKLCLSILELL